MHEISDIAESREAGRPIRMSFPRLLAWIGAVRAADIKTACGLAASWMQPLPPTGGATMVVRMAERFAHGASIERAAAREYLYRWRLTLERPAPARAVNGLLARTYSEGIFGVPHTLGL
jgi:hypothetical protein